MMQHELIAEHAIDHVRAWDHLYTMRAVAEGLGPAPTLEARAEAMRDLALAGARCEETWYSLVVAVREAEAGE
jgi:hypothetical protein